MEDMIDRFAQGNIFIYHLLNVLKLLKFSKEDSSNPRAWSKWTKLENIAIIASIPESFGKQHVCSWNRPDCRIPQDIEKFRHRLSDWLCCYVGIGPLLLAPLFETFGRKPLYLTCFTIFTLLQIPTALSPNLACLITMWTFAGFFGSVAIANVGGTISDMYEPKERAAVFGIYFLGPLLGLTLGPLLGGIILSNLEWRLLFWINLIICGVVTITSFIFLKETFVPVLLARRKRELQETEGGDYYFDREDDRPLATKLAQSIQRPLRILFTQPIVITMAAYQALIFAAIYSLYAQFQSIYGTDYNFDTLQVGLVYLGPGLGFLVAVWLLVPRIDTIFELSKKHGGVEKPEYRLPLANIGALLIPISLFWFAWAIEFHAHWFFSVAATFFYGIGQVAIFDSVQNYYIEFFEQYAASAIAAGALFRSIIGGVVPLFTTLLLDKYGVGWGMSIFGFVGVALAPSPLLFYCFGEGLRERFAIEL